MERDPHIRALVQPLIDALYELYEETDPSKGGVSEEGKLQLAQHAMHIWWRIFGRLLLWAQAQIVGYEIARSSPRWVDALLDLRGGDLSEDSHELELVGLMYPPNIPEGQRERVDALVERLENIEGDLNDEVLRKVIVRLLMSNDANTSFWRVPLQHALRATNAGERDTFFEPTKTRRRGRPYRLDGCRAMAISHVHYLVGKGFKKHIAIKRVADSLAVSAETLRDWEKALANDDFYKFDWDAALLAGHFEHEVSVKPTRVLEEEYGAEYLGGSSNIAQAQHFIEMIKTEWSLDNVKAALRKLQADDSNGG